MENIKSIVIENLIALRKANNYTQIELAKKVNFSDKAISRWENGEVVPDIETLNKLSEVYNLPLSYFFEKHELEKDDQKNNKNQLKNKILLSVISVLIVWTFASILFVYVKMLNNLIFWQCFIWAIPLSALVMLYYNKKWIKSKLVSLILQSIFIWSLITSFYLQFLNLNLWLVYIIGIPIQATIITRYYLK